MSSPRLLGTFFIAAGVNHFVMPRTYQQIVPPRLRREARRVVALSGAAEVAGGLGVMIQPTRRAAGVGLVALLAAVFPANVHGARAASLSADSALGAIRAATAAAADDVVGVARHTGMSLAPAPRR